MVAVIEVWCCCFKRCVRCARFLTRVFANDDALYSAHFLWSWQLLRIPCKRGTRSLLLHDSHLQRVNDNTIIQQHATQDTHETQRENAAHSHATAPTHIQNFADTSARITKAPILSSLSDVSLTLQTA